jgi:hypothetical protein
VTVHQRRLTSLLEPLGRVLVVRGPGVAAPDLPDLPGQPVVVDHDLVGSSPVGAVASEPDAVLLVVRDASDLRRVVASCRDLPSSTRLGCLVLEGDRPALTAGHPSWPPLLSLVAEAGPPCLTWAELSAPLAAGRFFADLARRTTASHLMSAGWPVLGLDGSDPRLWPAGDPTAVVGSPAAIAERTGDYPPDVLVLGSGPDPDPRQDAADHHVLGPVLTDLRLGEDLLWSAYQADTEGHDRRLGAAGTLALGGLDGQVLTPIGFVRHPQDTVRDLVDVPGTGLCRIDTVDGPVDIDTGQPLRPRDVDRLRSLAGVHVRWRGGEGPHAYCRLVVGLAMAGVPLSGDPAPPWARQLVHSEVLAAMAADRDSAAGPDPMAREITSIRLRRASHRHHGVRAWKDGIARRSGLAPAPRPLVSVLLPNRRPELLAFSLRQVVRQRQVDLEVVVAAHGHEPERQVLDALSATTGIRISCLVAPSDRPFGPG